MIVVLMGVSGAGKTTTGEALASALGWPFRDADNLHPAANVDKMRAGIPLTDDDRWPWLDRVIDEMRRVEETDGHVVFACSALKQSYRDYLARAGDVRFVYLAGDCDTIAQRLAARKHEYMPATLLASQFATLEPPTDALVIDVRRGVDEQVAAIRAGLGA
ncbi:MAG TPA: gluconokinase [Casimicrobiaceae bacterium]|jgi:gluconokinase|nr:gluconokinase [Casimicrobiaceae bacterium]